MKRDAKNAAPAAPSSGRGPQAFTTWLGVYPVLTAVAWLLEPVLLARPLAVRTLIMSALMVPIMVYGIMPLFQWLQQRNVAVGSRRLEPSNGRARAAKI